MTEHTFDSGPSKGSEASFRGTEATIDASVLALRTFDPTGLSVDQMDVLAGRFETLRRVVSSATARNRAELHRRLNPPPPPGDGDGETGGDAGTDGLGAGDGSGGDVGGTTDGNSRGPNAGAGPRPGDRGDKTDGDYDESKRQSKLARVASVLPSAIAAFDAGDITEAHIRSLWVAIHRDETRARHDEARLVRWARTRSPWRFRKVIANWCRFGENPEDRDAEQHAKRAVRVNDGHPDGMPRFDATMRTADGKSFLACLDALADDLYRAEHPDRPETRDQVTSTLAQRRHDALVEMARRCTAPGTPRRDGDGDDRAGEGEAPTAADRGGDDDGTGSITADDSDSGHTSRGRRRRRDARKSETVGGRRRGRSRVPGTDRRRPTITVIATLGQLRDQLHLSRLVDHVSGTSGLPVAAGHPDPAETPDGDTLTPAELRRLACDAEIIPIVMNGDSQPLDVGRSSRTIPLHIWWALVARDRGCRFCGAPAEWCDAHHIIHWADGGPTEVRNLVLACGRDHDHIHKGRLVLEGTADNLTWHRADRRSGEGGRSGLPIHDPPGSDTPRPAGAGSDPPGPRSSRSGPSPPRSDPPDGGGRLFAA